MAATLTIHLIDTKEIKNYSQPLLDSTFNFIISSCLLQHQSKVNHRHRQQEHRKPFRSISHSERQHFANNLHIKNLELVL